MRSVLGCMQVTREDSLAAILAMEIGGRIVGLTPRATGQERARATRATGKISRPHVCPVVGTC